MINKTKAYFQSMRSRDKRAVIFGISAIAVIVLYLSVVLPLFENWSCMRRQLKQYHTQLESISGRSAGSKAKLAGLYQTVPCLELPGKEDLQRKLFWDKTYDQIKKAGINLTSAPGFVAGRRNKTKEPAALWLNFTGSCKYEQFVKFLAQLNENPYLTGIEKLSIETDEKKPDQITIEMTIKTFVKQGL
jgi:hypothetical protein